MAPSGIDLIFPNKARVFDFTGSLGFDRHLPSGLLETDPNASFSGDKFVPVTKFQLKTDGFIYTAFRLDGEREREREEETRFTHHRTLVLPRPVFLSTDEKTAPGIAHKSLSRRKKKQKLRT
jgi:hypothetical protein